MSLFLQMKGPSRPLAVALLLAASMAVTSVSVQAQPLTPAVGGGGLFQPLYLRRDLTILAEDLKLDENQLVIIETLFEDYEAGFEKSARAVREAMAGARPTGAEPDEGVRQRRDELQQAIRALLEESRQRAKEAANDEERRQIEEEYRQRITEVRQELRDLSPSQRDPEQYAEMIETIRRVVGEWQLQRRGLDERFVADVMAVISDEQRALWPAVERKLRRDKTLRRGQFAGESLNLFHIAAGLELNAEAAKPLQPILQAYDTELDTALQARNRFLDEGAADGFGSPAQSERAGELRARIERELSLRLAVRDVNLRFAQSIEAALPDEPSSRFREDVQQQAYPRVFQPTRAQRMLDAATKLDDLDESTKAAVEELEASYLVELKSMNERLRRVTYENEPEQFRQRFQRRIEPGAPGDARPWEDPIRSAFNERREVGEGYITQLGTMLSDEQMRRLPGARRGGGASGQGGVTGAQGAESREWLMQHFDKNGDGRLDEEERDALREYFRKRAIDGRGGDEGR